MGQRIAEFDVWKPGYAAAVVYIYVAGTTTLANVYSDEDLTVVADNPQVLLSKSGAGSVNYGKFAVPIYTDQSYQMVINGIETTGIQRPSLSDLDGKSISDSLLTVEGSSYAMSMEKFGNLSVNAALYGVLEEGSGGVAATNTETIELAIAALSSGGEVNIPAGTYKVNSLDIPAGIILRGQGRGATVLQSVVGDVSFSVIGDRSGFRHMTLDGVSLSTDSIGVKSVGFNELVFDSVMIKRFETGLEVRGGKGHIYTDFSIENVEIGAKLHGDLDAANGNTGNAFEDFVWTGGLVSVASTIGLSLSYEDAVCHNIALNSVGFENCTGTSLDINGAQNIELHSVWFDGNTKNINIQDDSASLTPATSGQNDVMNVRFFGGRMNGGEFEVTGECQNIVLQNMKLEDVDFTMTTPLVGFLILQDCFEDNSVTLSGEATKLIRTTESNNGSSVGVTTSNTATKAWSITLDPGQMVYLVAKVIGRGRNVAQRAIYNIGCGAYRPGADLDYDTQTANFTAGLVVTGATSGATARIQADSDSGTTGTLTLIDINGSFIDNEIITDTGGGSATVNGSLTPADVSLDTIGNINIRAIYETNSNWACAFVANGPEVELRVTGDTSQTVEWTIDVDVVTN